MLPAPDAARVFAFLGIAFSSCICYDWRAVGYQFAAPYNRPRCSSTGGVFLLFGIMLDICKAASIFEIILGIHYAFNEPVMSFFLNKRFKIIYTAYIASVDKGIHNKTTKYGLPTY